MNSVDHPWISSVPKYLLLKMGILVAAVFMQSGNVLADTVTEQGSD